MLVFFDRTIKLKEVISVARAVVSIIPPFGKVRQLTDLVIFSDVKSYIPEWDTPDYLNACRKYAAQNKVYLVPSRFVADGGGDGFDFMILLQLRLVVQVAVGCSLDA